MTKELISEAFRWANGHPNRRSGELMRELADALEAASRERDAAPDAATEELRADEMTANEAIGLVLKRPGMYGLVPLGEHRAVKAERDAALEAVERVRAIHTPGKIIDVWGKSRSQADDFLVCVECTDPDNWWIAHPCSTIAALDGAPEPEEKP